MNRLGVLRFLACLLCMLITCTAVAAQPALYTRSTDKAFDFVLQDAEFAITERNFRIVQRLEIGRGIRERGYPDFPLSTVLLFCNLNYAQQLLSVYPAALHDCPYRVSVREADTHIEVGVLLLDETSAAAEIRPLLILLNQLFREIVDYAIADDVLPVSK